MLGIMHMRNAHPTETTTRAQEIEKKLSSVLQILQMYRIRIPVACEKVSRSDPVFLPKGERGRGTRNREVFLLDSHT
jgi:hypothetical protein